MISVCLASYNGSKYINEQINSILQQLSPEDELIVSDDHSTDNTVALVESIKDSRIKMIQNAEPLGVVKNFEQALLNARGEYIFLCDQDDIWLKNKVEACVLHLKNHLLVVTDCALIDESTQVISASFFEMRDSGEGIIKNIWKNTYLGCCMAFRRELLQYSLPMPSSIPMHDMWLGLMGELNGEVLFIEQKLSLYRRHESAVSATGSKSPFGIRKKIQLRLVLSFHLISRSFKNIIFGFKQKVYS